MLEIPQNLQQALVSGKVIPFVGAGVSMAVRELGFAETPLFPSWKQLLLQAATRLDSNDKKSEANVVRGLAEGRNRDYLESARRARQGMGADWFPFLREVFDPPSTRAANESLELARAVWSLSNNIVITTNYDRVLHWTCPNLQDLGYWDIEAAAEQSQLLRGTVSRPTIWHLHGYIRNAARIILTPDGYQRLYHDEQTGERSYQSALTTLRTLLNSHTFLFIGFSLDDESVAAQLRWISNAFEGAAGPHFMLVPLDKQEQVERNLQSIPAVELITFKEHGPPMAERIRELASVAHPSPASVRRESVAAVAPTPAADAVPLSDGGASLLAKSLLSLARRDALPPPVVDELFEAFEGAANRSLDEENLEALVLSRRLYTSRDPKIAKRLETLLKRRDLLPHAVAYGHHMLGWIKNRTGEFGPALAHFDLAMKAAEAGGARKLYSQILNTAGYAHRAKHSYTEAALHFKRSFDIKRADGDRIGLEITRQALAWLAAMRGRFGDAWRLFGEGIEASLASLAAPPQGMTREQLHDLIDSLAYHVIGRCTAGFLTGESPSSFEACRDQCEPWLESVLSIATAAGRELHHEAIHMLHLGVGTAFDTVPAQGILGFWSLVSLSIVDPDANAPLLSKYIHDEIDQAPADVHIKLLAGVALTSRVSGAASLAALRNEVISCLRDRCGYDGIADQYAKSWQRPSSVIRIDSSTWCGWGPLRHKRALLETPEAFVGPAATEHYLQLLAWMSLILLSADGEVNRHEIYSLIDETYPEGPSVRLNLGQSFGICHRVAQRCHPDSLLGKRLQKLWEEESFWAQSAYRSRSELSEERNRYSHVEDQTWELARAIVERHVTLIGLLLAPLQTGELPRIVCSDRVIATGDARPALIVDGQGKTYDCGALLMVDSRREADYYVPHLLSRSSLRGQRGQKSEFIRYEADPTARRTRVSNRWLDTNVR